MKNYYYVLLLFIFGVLILYSSKVSAILPLTGKTIIIDPGHGAEDVGTSFKDIYEKDINLSISQYLEEELSKLGAIVILTRNGDYDLSTPNANRRKKSDFDNRIKLINESKADLYLSIHLNFLNDFKYFGPQVFYNKENKKLAEYIQERLNGLQNSNRKVKMIPNDTYMYKKLNKNGVLIECGFLSNYNERNLLKTSSYQKEIAKAISKGIVLYF